MHLMSGINLLFAGLGGTDLGTASFCDVTLVLRQTPPWIEYMIL